ncbi:MAG: type I-B CRISPR-associated protein Cas8b1/Cst1 [Anaerolineae bacterium]
MNDAASNDLMLDYTGHPLVDVGLATLTAFAEKDNPSELQEADLAKAAEYMQRIYVVNPMKSFLHGVVFPNSGFVQPAYESQPEKRAIYSERVLTAFAQQTLAVNDPFFGLPISAVPYDLKGELPPGRAYRQHFPLLTSEGVINFWPNGQTGLPISGVALLAIQALPLGCAKCMGRLLAVHSDDPEIMQHFAGRFLRTNRQSIALAQEAGVSKLPEHPRSALTLLIETLLDAERMKRQTARDMRPCSVTAYHLSNSGQSPSLSIYHLPLHVVRFLRRMALAEFKSSWDALTQRAWQTPGKKDDAQTFSPRYNALYEDLFALPDKAGRFIRTYFLRVPRTYGRDRQDPSIDYSPRKEAHLVSWKITAEFIKEVLHMATERTEQIREMGDRLARYVDEQNDKGFFRSFSTANRYGDLRTVLLRAVSANLRRGGEPLLTFDPYIVVFEDGEELGRSDWRLARDLVLIRMIEQLHSLGWLGSNKESLPTEEELATASLPEERGN